MVGHAMDRGGLKDSENASNSFFPKINRTVFWDLGTDMLLIFLFFLEFLPATQRLSLIVL